MPNVAAMIITVGIVVTTIKVFAAKLNILIQGAAAFIVSILAAIGVWGYHVLMTGTPIDFGVIMLLVEVIVGATMGYKLLPDSVKNFDLKNLRGDVLNGN